MAIQRAVSLRKTDVRTLNVEVFLLNPSRSELLESAIQNMIRYLSRQVALASREANVKLASANTLPWYDEYAHEHILLSRVPELGMNKRSVVYSKERVFNQGSAFLKSGSHEMKKELGVDPNGTEFVITTGDCPESLDASSLIVGKVLNGMDVVERIAGVKTVQENASAPQSTVAILIGLKFGVNGSIFQGYAIFVVLFICICVPFEIRSSPQSIFFGGLGPYAGVNWVFQVVVQWDCFSLVDIALFG
ncbi:hypothetical protein NE237_017645 [Protea cynaroides]|uniref:PPIase cyclophilin-type domain-containing protein n=1 Tax=Protea cynaroides TaxID=273540 RepID=A0A9Q0K8G7_9MAGN|nr:hypothetical protein NE237_017645 [Protea cynaroides]